MDEISRGVKHCAKLLGDFKTKTDQRIPLAVKRAEEEMTMSSARRKQREADQKASTTTEDGPTRGEKWSILVRMGHK